MVKAKSSNKIIFINLKKRLHEKKGRWAEALLFFLWVDRTNYKVATCQNPYFLVFRAEVMISTEVVIPTARYLSHDQENNDTILAQDLENIDELMDLANICITAHQHRIPKTYNKNIKDRRFRIGDLVLRRAFQNTKDHNTGKLAPKWEGPYFIDAEAGKGAYWLATLDENVFPRS